MQIKVLVLRSRRAMFFSLFTLLIILVSGPIVNAASASKRQIATWAKLLYSDDPVIRSSVATSLLSVEEDAALKAVFNALQPEQPEAVRISIFRAFGIKGDDRAIELLIRALNDPSDDVRRAVTGSLRMINTPHAISFLMQEAARGPDQPVQVRTEVMNVLADLHAIDAIPSLIELLKHDDETIRKSAQKALERITLRSYPSITEWRSWWERSSKMSREEMLEDLVLLQGDRIRNMSQLIEKLYLQVLGDRKNREDPTPLIEALAVSDSAKVKLYAIKELSALRGKPVVEALVKALSDTEAAVRQSAAESLGNKGDPEAILELLSTLKDPSAVVRAAAARSLGALKAKEAIPVLLSLLMELPVEPASASAVALGEIGEADAVDMLIQVVIKADADPELIVAAAGALAKIRDPRAIPVFLELLSSAKYDLRWLAADTLGEMRAHEAITPLSEIALKDPNSQIREVALAALGKVGDPAALDPVLISLTDAEARVADQALRSLIMLANGDASTYTKALDRLIVARRYTQAEKVLSSALEQIKVSSNHSKEMRELRIQVVRGFMAADQWGLARPILEALVASPPKETEYLEELSSCLLALRDYDALFVLLAQARRAVPETPDLWWKDTVTALEQLTADGQFERVIAIVNALEKDNPDLGNVRWAKQLQELREKAKNSLQSAALKNE